MGKYKLPPMTGEPVIHVDATPDEGYPLRILRAHRQNCDCRWSDTYEGGDTENPLLRAMNEANDKRAAILDRAISVLEEAQKHD